VSSPTCRCSGGSGAIPRSWPDRCTPRACAHDAAEINYHIPSGSDDRAQIT
jgi:hypothetical protein